MINNIKKYIEFGLSSRQIARAMGVSRNTVKKYVKDQCHSSMKKYVKKIYLPEIPQSYN